MSRKRTKPEDIRDSDHYFNRYVAKEAVHIRGEQQIYNSFVGFNYGFIKQEARR